MSNVHMGTETISANVLFYFFLSNIIFSVKAWCGGIDGNFLKLLQGQVKLNFVTLSWPTVERKYLTKTINIVPKIELLTRNCNLICSFMICVMKQLFWLCIF